MGADFQPHGSFGLIFIKLNICAVLCKGRNIKLKVQSRGSGRADLTPGEALAASPAAMGHLI